MTLDTLNITTPYKVGKFGILILAIVSNRNTQQIAAGDVAAWNVLIAPRNGITAAAIFIVSEL